MRKLGLLLIMVVLLMSFVACENEQPNNSNEGIENQTTNETKEETNETSEDTGSDYDLPSRSDIPDEYKWDLTKIFVNNGAYMNSVESVREDLSVLNEMKGNINNIDDFYELFTLFEDISRRVDTIYVYASLQAHTDTANTEFTDLEDIATQITTEFSEATSFMLPMIAEMNEEVLSTYLEDDRIQPYKVYIDSIMKEKDHILSEDEEAILAQAQVLYDVPESIYEAFNYLVDFSEYLPQPDWDKFWMGSREDKEEALTAYYLQNSVGIDLISEIYESEIKKNTFFAKARNYDSALDSVLVSDGMTRQAYDRLFEITHENLDLLHDWISLKKEILKIEDQLHVYDLYTPIIDDPYAFIEYEPGKTIIYNALAPLGDKYLRDLQEGFSSRWADVYTTEGKYEGGYQWGTYDTEPYVLLNFYGYMTDVSTVAHEMGHALNFKYSNENNPYFASSIPIFNAEIASTTNEALVFEYRVKNAENKAEKQRALLNYIELIENTVFTQMIYAEFEHRAYEVYEAGEPISSDLFKEIMIDVYTLYYGSDFAADEMASMQWAEIPHFYNAFYVYKYATGLSAGLTFADMILNGNQEDVDKYMDYLAAGSSDQPLTLLKNAGVDFSTGQPIQKAFDKFEELMNEFKKTL